MNDSVLPNILIIDDNPKNIQLAANVLKNSNRYNIYFATSGEKGLEQLEKRNHALILLDINMPGLDGYETAKIIKNSPLYQSIPLIFLSANANQESINRGFEYGGEDYITKPFQDHELLHRVKTHVELFLLRERLQKEVNDYSALLEQYKVAIDADSLVSKTDKKGVITYVNDEFCKVSGYSCEELIGYTHNIVRHPHTAKAVFKQMWETIQSKQVWKGQMENRAKNGSSYFVKATIIPILDSEGEIVEYISVRTDITETVQAKEDVINTQKEILFTLGELGEARSKETGEHVQRVALFSELLALKYGLDEVDASLLKMASPMHDIGKVAIPDRILLKPGALTEEEFTQMQTHSQIGYEIFHKSSHKILQMAARISYEHHERYDGKGYPRGLKGEEISIEGRITAIADVFDALSHDRVYKKAWSVQDTLTYMQDQSGKAFDPALIALLLENIDEVLAIKERYAV